MGKNLIQQRRGKGTSTYRAMTFRSAGAAKYLPVAEAREATIADIISSSHTSSPLASVLHDDGRRHYIIAPEGIRVGDMIHVDNTDGAILSVGSYMPLKNIPAGTFVFNIESSPGDGGKFVRASGTFARVLSHYADTVLVLLPSKKEKIFSAQCRATIGVAAGGGRTEKPLLKAGHAFYKMKAKNKYWPKVCGVSMNAVAHPFGGSSSHIKGRPTQASRNAPPGRKVGKIAPSRTGRRKR